MALQSLVTSVYLREALDDAFSVYDRASLSVGEASFDAGLVEASVRLRLSSPRLAEPILLPLLHRRIAPSGPTDLTVSIFDQVTTGHFPGIVGILDRLVTNPAETMAWTFGDLNLAYRREPMPSLMGFDRVRNRALLWLDDAAKVERWDRCRALLQLLHWWLADRGWQAIHAAAVCSKKGGVLIGGKGGAGKSTTALACVRAGWTYAGDDYVIIRSTPRPRVENLFGTARLRLDMLERLPEMRTAVSEVYKADTYEKASLVLGEKCAPSSFGGFPVKAIVLPRHSGKADYTVTPASRAQAMLALAPTTMIMLQSVLSSAFQQIAAFVQVTPAYWCDVGPDLARIPAAIETILEPEESR